MMDERDPRNRMAGELLPPAIDELHRIITDPSAKNSDKIAAIKTVMVHTLGPSAPRQNKAPEEMTAAEIAHRITELRSRQVAFSDAAKLIDLTPSSAPARPPEIFD